MPTLRGIEAYPDKVIDFYSDIIVRKRDQSFGSLKQKGLSWNAEIKPTNQLERVTSPRLIPFQGWSSLPAVSLVEGKLDRLDCRALLFKFFKNELIHQRSALHGTHPYGYCYVFFIATACVRSDMAIYIFPLASLPVFTSKSIRQTATLAFLNFERFIRLTTEFAVTVQPLGLVRSSVEVVFSVKMSPTDFSKDGILTIGKILD